MNVFLPESHINTNFAVRLIFAIGCLPLMLACFQGRFADHMLWIMILVSLIIIFEIVVERKLNYRGLYIVENCLFYRFSTKQQSINISEIVAIKISKSLSADIIGPFRELKDIEGEQLYSMFLLDSIREKAEQHDDGDLRFLSNFRKCIICRCIYDQSAIDYLLTLNPNIIVF